MRDEERRKTETNPFVVHLSSFVSRRRSSFVVRQHDPKS